MMNKKKLELHVFSKFSGSTRSFRCCGGGKHSMQFMTFATTMKRYGFVVEEQYLSKLGDAPRRVEHVRHRSIFFSPHLPHSHPLPFTFLHPHRKCVHFSSPLHRQINTPPLSPTMPLNTLRLNAAPSSHPNSLITFIKPLPRPPPPIHLRHSRHIPPRHRRPMSPADEIATPLHHHPRRTLAKPRIHRPQLQQRGDHPVSSPKQGWGLAAI